MRSHQSKLRVCHNSDLNMVTQYLMCRQWHFHKHTFRSPPHSPWKSWLVGNMLQTLTCVLGVQMEGRRMVQPDIPSTVASDVVDASHVSFIDETMVQRPDASNTTGSSQTLTGDSEDKEQRKKCLVFKLPGEVQENKQQQQQGESHQSSAMNLEVLFQGQSDDCSSTLTNDDSSTSCGGPLSPQQLLASSSTSATSPSLEAQKSWALDVAGPGQGARPKQRMGPAPVRSPDTEDSC